MASLEGTNWISNISSWDSGGGMEIDIVELKDGRVIEVSEEAAVHYENIEDLEPGEAAERQTIFL